MSITRAHLKKALDSRDWDLFDQLLVIDSSYINDPQVYTDTWGAWWGFLMECIREKSSTGVTILLKHGADRNVGLSGDCESMSPFEAASMFKTDEILTILRSNSTPVYKRTKDSPVPSLNADDVAINKQGEIRDRAGILFQKEIL